MSGWPRQEGSRRTRPRKWLASTRRQPVKTKEAAGLDKKAAQFDAVNEYLAFVDKKCTYKVESYAERKACREAEINSPKEDLDILEKESAFVQTLTADSDVVIWGAGFS